MGRGSGGGGRSSATQLSGTYGRMGVTDRSTGRTEQVRITTRFSGMSNFVTSNTSVLIRSRSGL